MSSKTLYNPYLITDRGGHLRYDLQLFYVYTVTLVCTELLP